MLLKTARELANAGDVTACFKAYTELIVANDQNPVLWAERAIISMRSNLPELALSDFLRAQQLLNDTRKHENLLEFLAESFSYHNEDGAIETPVDQGRIDAELDSLSDTVIRMIPVALANLQLFGSAEAALQCVRPRSLEDRQKLEGNRAAMAEAARKHPNVGRIRSTARYPWDVYDFRRSVWDVIFGHLAGMIAAASQGQLELRVMTDEQVAVVTGRVMQCGEMILDTAEDLITAHAYLGDANELACDFCARTLSSERIRCGNAKCKSEFCAPSCRDKAIATYHTFLCGKDLSPLAASITEASTTKTLIPLLILKLFAMAKGLGVHPLDLQQIRGLMTIKYAEKKHSPFDETVIATFRDIVTILGHDGNQSRFDAQFDFWIYLTQYHILTCNVFAMRSLTGRPWKIYLLPAVAMMNHSCTPNCELIWKNAAPVVTTLSKIKEGEEATISYIDSKLGFKERQDLLLHGWGFRCACPKCSKLQ